MRILVVLFLLMPLWGEASEYCKPQSRRVFCRLKSCIEETSWQSQKVQDPILQITEDKNFRYDQLLIPMGHTGEPTEFHMLSKKGLTTYQFEKVIKLKTQCQIESSFATLPLEGECKSFLPFGWGCLMAKKNYLKVSPFRINYWDSKKVNYICQEFTADQNSSLKVKAISRKKEETAKLVTPLLKMRMKQLARAIKGDSKSIDYKKILNAIQDSSDIEKMGPCRFFLDGNTLNLIKEDIEKIILKKKAKES